MLQLLHERARELYINPRLWLLELCIYVDEAAAAKRSGFPRVRRGGRKLLEFSKSDVQDIMKREDEGE